MHYRLLILPTNGRLTLCRIPRKIQLRIQKRAYMPNNSHNDALRSEVEQVRGEFLLLRLLVFRSLGLNYSMPEEQRQRYNEVRFRMRELRELAPQFFSDTETPSEE